ncbi:hypothetical protein ACOALZ_15680 [Nocardiopsis algeriensis]|uniref:hypothetical protein n=1 Tax=Nocardiopsis algeriensis TaxID=1478215 RepID=UPI003B430615
MTTTEPPVRPAPRGRSAARAGWDVLRTWTATTPARVWLLTVLCVATVLGLFASASFTLGQTREGLDVLGRDAGPQAMATTELYLALADMDAKTSDVLLMGTDHDLGSGRDDALEQYEASRRQANEALLHAASLTEGDTVEERNVQEVLEGMGAYEQLATEARLRNDEAEAPPGEVDGQALETYRRATLMMHTELLPKAFNLGLDSSAIVRADHEERQASVAVGLLGVGGAGAAAMLALVALQGFLRVRFHRRFNLPLLGATLLTGALTLGAVLALDTSGGYQREAKEEGLDAAMSLARAQAIATDMQADQSRYLLDPEMADNYQQVYLERAQQVLFRPVNNLEDYYDAVEEVAVSYPELPGRGGAGEDDPGTLGYLGQKAQDAVLPGHEDELAEVLEAYSALQGQDEELRAAAGAGDTEEAIGVRMGITHSEDGAFRDYEQALGDLTDLHEEAFEQGIGRGDAVLALWLWLLPAGAAALLLLILFGVRPRLTEYR